MISDEERVALVRLTKRGRVDRHVAFRARIVLACASMSSNADVAHLLRVSAKTVGMRRRRFIEFRVDALYDEPRVGAPRKVSDEAIEAVIVKTVETTPKGRTHWSTRKMAKNAGISHSTASCRHRRDEVPFSPGSPGTGYQPLGPKVAVGGIRVEVGGQRGP